MENPVRIADVKAISLTRVKAAEELVPIEEPPRVTGKIKIWKS